MMEKKRANYLSFLGSKTVERWVRTRATKADLGKSHCCLHQPVALPVALSPALGRHSPLLAMHVRQDNPSSNSCRRSQKQPTPSTATPNHGPVTHVVLQEQRASIWDTGTPPYRRDLCDGDERQTRRRCNCNSSNSPPLLLDLQQKMETPSQPVVVALAHVCCRRWHRDECWSPRGLGVQVTKPGQTARRGSTSPEPSERRPLCDGPSELCIVLRYLGHSRQFLRDISG